MSAQVISFPTATAWELRKINRLNELKEIYLRLIEMEEGIFAEAMALTGEKEANGHTQAFLSNERNKTAEQLLIDLVDNPSHLWFTEDAEPVSWPEELY